jgi:MinD superfamily P-loop ATPase
MKEITILSGKGGTGKTSITAAIASVAQNTVFSDNDVDAADLHLIFHPEIEEKHRFSSGWKAIIDQEKCTQCGLCKDYCRFDAIAYNGNGQLIINPYKCEGCRLCERICPQQAIYSEQNSNNHWYVSSSRFGKFIHAKMGAGEENSGKLVTQVRKKAREIATKTNANYLINDGPPGVGCATISSLSGIDLALIVIEPTKSGLHDAKRLLELSNSFKIKSMALINKCDINREVTNEVEQFLNQENIPLLAKIPFDKEMVEAMIEGKSIVEYNPESNITEKIKTIWQTIK